MQQTSAMATPTVWWAATNIFSNDLKSDFVRECVYVCVSGGKEWHKQRCCSILLSQRHLMFSQAAGLITLMLCTLALNCIFPVSSRFNAMLHTF